VKEDLDSAKRYRVRAAKLRLLAESSKGEARKALLDVADDYERLAKARERIAKHDPPDKQ
jgi:hypothetical protein